MVFLLTFLFLKQTLSSDFVKEKTMKYHKYYYQQPVVTFPQSDGMSDLIEMLTLTLTEKCFNFSRKNGTCVSQVRLHNIWKANGKLISLYP